MKGENVMKAFDESEFEKYKEEAKAKWGATDAYKEHAGKTKGYSKDKWQSLAGAMNEIMAAFAACMQSGEKPDSEKAHALVHALKTHITDNYYACTNEILYGLGQMYVLDERFKTNIDKHAEGNAQYISDAIKAYCGK